VTAPVVRVNGCFLGGERGGRHDGGVFEGAGYSSAVLPGGVGLVWLNGVVEDDAVVEAAWGFGSRRLVRVGCGLGG